MNRTLTILFIYFSNYFCKLVSSSQFEFTLASYITEIDNRETRRLVDLSEYSIFFSGDIIYVRVYNNLQSNERCSASVDLSYQNGIAYQEIEIITFDNYRYNFTFNLSDIIDIKDNLYQYKLFLSVESKSNLEKENYTANFLYIPLINNNDIEITDTRITKTNIDGYELFSPVTEIHCREKHNSALATIKWTVLWEDSTIGVAPKLSENKVEVTNSTTFGKYTLRCTLTENAIGKLVVVEKIIKIVVGLPDCRIDPNTYHGSLQREDKIACIQTGQNNLSTTNIKWEYMSGPQHLVIENLETKSDNILRNLTILNETKGGTYEYRCICNDGNTATHIKFDVYVPVEEPNITTIDSSEVPSTFHKDLQLVCIEKQGYPKATISWKVKQNQELLLGKMENYVSVTDNRLQLSPDIPIGSYNITCTVENSFSADKSSMVNKTIFIVKEVDQNCTKLRFFDWIFVGIIVFSCVFLIFVLAYVDCYTKQQKQMRYCEYWKAVKNNDLSGGKTL